MADKRISELTAVVAPLGTDEFPCEQGGVAKKETRTQITATVTANLASHMAAIPATHANNSISDALIRASNPRSVIGRSANSAGNVADIIGLDNQVLAVQSATHTLIFQSVSVAMMTDGTEIVTIPTYCYQYGGAGDDWRYALRDAEENAMVGRFRIPADYVSDGTVYVVGWPYRSGNANLTQCTVYGGAGGELWTTHNTAGGASVVACVNSRWTQLYAVNIGAWASAGDNIEMLLVRDATVVADTIDDTLEVYAYFTYTANHGG